MTNTDETRDGQHCCEAMSGYLQHGDVALLYVGEFREYGIRVLDGGSSYIVIRFCPWCGQKLPSSLRDEWFNEIERLGLDATSPNIPASLASDQWWRDPEKGTP